MTRSHLSAVTAALLVAAACSGPVAGPDSSAAFGPAEHEVIFLAQSARPNAVMEALYRGDVIVDRAGCVRLEAPASSTVVWPYGVTLDEDGTLRVRDAGGRVVGRLGARFTFGGGHVPFLHDGIPLTEADRALATAECPGDFWIVGDLSQE